MEDLLRKNQNTFVKIHPQNKANWLSSLCCCWTIPIFMRGLKKDLTEEDLYEPLKSHESRLLTNKIKKIWDKETKLNKKNPSFRKVILKTFYSELLYYIFFLLIQEVVVKMGKPILVGKLMEYYRPFQTTITQESAYYYAFGIFILSLMDVMLLNYSYFGLQHLSMKMQVACRSLIFRKALKLNREALTKSTIGQMINLMSNDVSRFSYLCLHLHQAFIAPIQTVVVLYLLFATVNPSAMVGVALIIAFVPVLMYMGKLTSKFRLRTALKTDNRIRLMNEIISGVQIIKMYTWEKPFAKLVEQARRLELKEIKSNTYVRALNLSASIVLVPTSIFLCVLTFVTTGNTLTAQFVYVTTPFYNQLRHVLTLHLPRCITMLAELNISLKRLESFLLNAEVLEDVSNPSSTTNINLEKVDVKWTPSSDLTLKNINLQVSNKELIAVVGRVGCGKTTLIHTILKEIPISSGKLEVNGKVSYASQEPWLFSASIRQNILFGEEMDVIKYKKVVEVCALGLDFASFPFGDRTIVGEKGIMLSGGQKARVCLARAVYRNADIYLLDDPLSAVDVKVGKQLFDNCISNYLKDKLVILVTHQIQYLNNVDKIYLLEDGTLTLADKRNFTNTDFINDEENNQNLTLPSTHNELPKEVKEHRSVGQVSKKVYLHYFKSGGNFLLPILVFLTFILTQLLATGTDYFLTFWVNLEQNRLENGPLSEFWNFFTPQHLLYFYSGLILCLILMVLARSICFVRFSMSAAQKLHDRMFETVVRATMRFFTTNPSGRILNRFSRDVGIIDEGLPPSITECVQVFFNVIAIAVVVSLLNKWLIIPTIIMFGIFYIYKIIFVATSRNLKRIESTTRSPLFSHLTASLQGLSTIRAFGARSILEKEFDHIQDNHSSAAFLFIACSRTFAFWLDVKCTIYVGFVILSFLFIGTEKYGGNVGLAITQTIALTGMLQRGIRQWSDLENQMTSVERIFEYSELPAEPDHGKKSPPKEWPQKGSIEFDGVFLKYSEDDPFVLKNLTFGILAKEKIGIVGRTGAGKSSIISALFRLANIEGIITIDGVNTAEIPLKDLRRILSIIPQDPVLFSGALRKNLDPFEEYQDDDLWKALEEVDLKKAVNEMPLGLSTKLSEGGSNLSVGQRQLVCLARALVRKNKILVLDEATANVDLQTDELIVNTIRRKFQNCTVLTVAHRLHTIMDSDKVLVMDNGKVIEYDHPFELIQKQGLFYTMVQQTGKAVAANLTNIAKESYQARKDK